MIVDLYDNEINMGVYYLSRIPLMRPMSLTKWPFEIFVLYGFSRFFFGAGYWVYPKYLNKGYYSTLPDVLKSLNLV